MTPIICGSPYYKIESFILVILALSLLTILIAHYSEKFLLKKFFHRLKQLLNKGDETDVESLKEKTIPRKDNSGFMERFLSRENYRFYPYLKEELFVLMGKASKTSDKYTLASAFQSFSEGIKRKLSVRSDKIKFIILFSLPAVLIAVVDSLNSITATGIYEKDEATFFKIAFLTMAEAIAYIGTLLVIIFFFALIVHFSIKKKFNLIMDETDDIISTVCRNKTGEK
ncbi:MAG: hypothetical protein GY940_22200 [bacterium]|nr:hypothetical protein [bacterium]